MKKIKFILCLFVINSNLVSMPPKIPPRVVDCFASGVTGVGLSDIYKRLNPEEQKFLKQKIEEKDMQIAQKDIQLDKKDVQLAQKDIQLAEKDQEIKEWKERYFNSEKERLRLIDNATCAVM